MNEIYVFGKQSFTSKAGKVCNILHFGVKNDNVEGWAVKTSFVSASVFDKAEVDSLYNCIYGVNYNGSAYIEDIQ